MTPFLKRRAVRRFLVRQGMTISGAALDLLEMRALRILHEACGRTQGNRRSKLRAGDL